MYGGNYTGNGPQGGRHSTRRWLAIGVGLAIIVVLVVLLLLFWTGTIGVRSGSPRPYFGYWGGFFLIFILIWVSFLVIRIAFWSARVRGGGYGRGPRRDPAVMVARQRYARGEITREQYDQIMTDLGRRGRGPGGPLSGA
ncbi:MAG: hypothetical protein WBF81_08645 [Thermoplasmata archaeon]